MDRLYRNETVLAFFFRGCNQSNHSTKLTHKGKHFLNYTKKNSELTTLFFSILLVKDY